MGHGHQPVQIHPPDIIFRKDDDVKGRKLFDRRRIRLSQLIDLIQRVYVSGPEHFQKFHKDIRRTCRVIHRPVMMMQRDIQRFCHIVQLELAQIRQQKPRH